MARHRQVLIDLALAAAVLTTIACTPPEPKSAIVDKVEQAGSGSLSQASTDSIQLWFVKHRDLSHDVDEMCKRVRQNATVQWTETTEGKTCTAARNIEVMRSVPAQGDGRKFQPGLH
jgi:hypothetical protein